MRVPMARCDSEKIEPVKADTLRLQVPHRHCTDRLPARVFSRRLPPSCGHCAKSGRMPLAMHHSTHLMGSSVPACWFSSTSFQCNVGGDVGCMLLVWFGFGFGSGSGSGSGFGLVLVWFWSGFGLVLVLVLVWFWFLVFLRSVSFVKISEKITIKNAWRVCKRGRKKDARTAPNDRGEKKYWGCLKITTSDFFDLFQPPPNSTLNQFSIQRRPSILFSILSAH